MNPPFIQVQTGQAAALDICQLLVLAKAECSLKRPCFSNQTSIAHTVKDGACAGLVHPAGDDDSAASCDGIAQCKHRL